MKAGDNPQSLTMLVERRFQATYVMADKKREKEKINGLIHEKSDGNAWEIKCFSQVRGRLDLECSIGIHTGLQGKHYKLVFPKN